MYALIKPDEDGNPVRFLTSVEDLLKIPGDYGIEKFLSKLPENTDPNYWRDGDVLLLKVEILKPRLVATGFAM